MEKLITGLQSQVFIPIFSSEDGHTSAKQRMFQDSETSVLTFSLLCVMPMSGNEDRCHRLPC